MVDKTPQDGLRTLLRGETRAAHETLDAAMAGLDLADPGDYARFLRIQYAARIGVEAWLVRHAPDDLQPPPQAPAIAADLKALGEALPLDQPLFAADAGEDALGVAWVIAGSSLGNRAMLSDLRKRGHEGQPASFLGNEDMAIFWHDFRPRIDSWDGAPQAAVSAAHATFAHFSATAATYLPQAPQ